MNKKRTIVIMAIVAAFLAVPIFDRNQYHVYILDRALLNCMIASGLVALTGFAGQMSLGHAAFYGIGAYASAILTTRVGLPVWLGIILAAGLCLLVGMLLSIPSFRVSGFYLSLVTISFGNIVWALIVNWQSLTGGPLGFAGIPPVRFGGQPISKVGFFYLAAAILASIFLVSYRLANSFIGRGLRAMSDDEMAAETAGIDTKRLKLLVFSLSAAYAGIAGGLYAHLSTFLSPESFVQGESANFVAMSVVGGLRHILGGVIGGLTVTVIPEFLRVKGWEVYYLMGSSLAILVLVILLPSGLAPTIERGMSRLFGTSQDGQRK
ncbi:MAG: branched-chain amino acid ABC transporter permease [Clostridia bacterium]|nr:branched-chain amino acid ABC transporter permease [Clostridia bacterium]